jgi:hypothetical protein
MEEILGIVVFSLVFIISLLSICQNDYRRQTALYFSLLTLAHTLLWGMLPESKYYYITAAANDFLIIQIITRLKYKTKLTERLSVISLMFIMLNAVYFTLYAKGVYTLLPAYMAIVLYLSVIWALLTWDGEEGGNYRFNLLDWFRNSHNRSVYAYQKLPSRDRN